LYLSILQEQLHKEKELEGLEPDVLFWNLKSWAFKVSSDWACSLQLRVLLEELQNLARNLLAGGMCSSSWTDQLEFSNAFQQTVFFLASVRW
jgi:hypothetical protein